MKCICRNKCQARLDDDKIMFFYPGDIQEFEECPPHFEAVTEAKIDFTTAQEDELREAKWSFEEAHAVMLETYDAELKRVEGETTKQDVIDQILDIRFRALDIDPNKVV